MSAAGPPRLIFMYGPAAVGKLTVAREIARRTGLGVFHNYLVVDALLSVFDFGSDTFCRLREHMWLSIFTEAIRAGRTLMFTFAAEATVSPGFIDRVSTTVTAAGGEVAFVELICTPEVQDARIANGSRAEFSKLRAPDVLRRIRGESQDVYPMPVTPLVSIDTASTTPVVAAARIIAALTLDPQAPGAYVRSNFLSSSEPAMLHSAGITAASAKIATIADGGCSGGNAPAAALIKPEASSSNPASSGPTAAVPFSTIEYNAAMVPSWATP